MDNLASLFITVGIIGLILGVLLGLASKFLVVKEDPRLADLISMLPGFNCGACGNPGCEGMARSIIGGETNLKLCKPGKEDMREKISKYMKENPTG